MTDLASPGEVRNDLYLTLMGVEFDRGNKKAQKNVEARVTVYNQNYQLIEDSIVRANGAAPTSSFYSSVLYHCNSPRWGETIKVSR